VLAALNEKTFVATVLLQCTNYIESMKKIRSTIMSMEEKPQFEMYLADGEETIDIMMVHSFRELVSFILCKVTNVCF
jgi:ABC-type dipeptide/oligopeptide/nickel transport system permease subunit